MTADGHSSLHFDDEADRYDRTVVRLIEGYGEQNAAVLAALPFESGAPLRFLDLGCGTGVLGELLLGGFPEASVHAVDIAPRMIEACRARLERYGERATFEVADFSAGDLGGCYDAVVSGLATHHLPEAERPALYARVCEALREHGIFVNREVVSGETDEETAELEERWKRFMVSQGEDPEFWYERHLAEDHAVPLSRELAWLDAAGFREVGVVWRGGNVAVMAATR